MRKFTKGLLILAAGAVFIMPNFSSARQATIEELQAQIQALLEQIKALQATRQPAIKQNVIENSECRSFKTNLKVGDQSVEVTNLVRALVKEGLLDSDEMFQDGRTALNFDERVASAVTAFQEKYRDEILTPSGLKNGTGYVGPSTRKKLNQLYGCGVVPSGTPYISYVRTIDERDTIKAGETIGIYGSGLSGVTTVWIDSRNVPVSGATDSYLSFFAPSDLASGTAYVFVQSKGDKSNTISVKVVGSKTAVGKLYIEPASPYHFIQVGETLQLQAAYQPPMPKCAEGVACAQVMPAAYPVGVLWSTDKKDIVSLKHDGGEGVPADKTYVTGVGAGTAELKAVYILPSLGCAGCPSGGVVTATTKVNVVNTTQPSITVLSPNGGEVWQVGQTYQIRWNATGLPAGDKITGIQLSYLNSGATSRYEDVIASFIENTGVYSWTIPMTYASGKQTNQYLMRVLYSGPDGRVSAEDYSNAPFSITAAGTTDYKLSANYVSGNKSSYAAGEKISLVIKGVELFDGSPGEPSEGFNVQAYTRGVNDGYRLQGVNAVYNSQTGYWEAKLTAPADTAKNYRIESAFYCSNSSLACGKRYASGIGGGGSQIDSSFNFLVYGSGRTPVMVVSPNGGESYQAGQSAQMPIKWTADCGYKYFSIMLAKGTYYGFSSQTINDSVPAGVCSSGQSAIPYYTTWSIPSNLAAGSDYKVVVTGQLADSVVGQFGDGIGDDSDAPFTITAGDKVSVVATDSDNSPDYLTNYIAYPITPERYPDLFRKGVGTGIYAGSSPTYHAIYGIEPNPLTPKSTSNAYSTFYDHCANSSQLNEAFVQRDGKLGAFGSPAPAGYACVNGAFTATSTKPSITVLSPNGGETWVAGSAQTIRWDGSELPLDAQNKMALEFQKGSNVVKRYLNQANDGAETLVIPSDLTPGNDYKVNILYYYDPANGRAYIDSSNSPFTITAEPVATGSLSIEPANPKLEVGGKPLQLRAMYQPPMPYCPSGAYCDMAMPAALPVLASWDTSNSGIVNILTKPSAEGITISGVGAGFAEVKAVYNLPSGGAVTAATKVNVVSAAMTVPTIIPSKPQVTSGEIISVSWSVPGATTPKDWIGIAPRGGQWSSSYNWFYTDGLASGSKTITMPMSAGSYDLVYYPNNGFTELTRTGPVTVTAGVGSRENAAKQNMASVLDSMQITLDLLSKAVNDLR